MTYKRHDSCQMVVMRHDMWHQMVVLVLPRKMVVLVLPRTCWSDGGASAAKEDGGASAAKEDCGTSVGTSAGTSIDQMVVLVQHYTPLSPQLVLPRNWGLWQHKVHGSTKTVAQKTGSFRWPLKRNNPSLSRKTRAIFRKQLMEKVDVVPLLMGGKMCLLITKMKQEDEDW